MKALTSKTFAWYGDNASCSTNGPARCLQTRGGRSPNSWGFYDFYGNVREWVHDEYQQTYPIVSP